MVGLESMLERLKKAGMHAEVIGDGRSAKLVVDGTIVGIVCDDVVTLL